MEHKVWKLRKNVDNDINNKIIILPCKINSNRNNYQIYEKGKKSLNNFIFGKINRHICRPSLSNNIKIRYSDLRKNESKELIMPFYRAPNHLLSIDLNRLRRYRALEFRQPVTQGNHSLKRSLYKALHKRLSLVLRRWRPVRTISYRPFLKHQWFAVWSL